jgi:protein O-GlcNAc transferase
LRSLGRLDEAAAALEAAIALRPDSVDALVSLAMLMHEQGRADEAFAVIAQAIALAPNHVGARISLGRLEHLRGNLAAAEAAYRRALADEPGLVSALASLGAVLKDRGDLAAAAECLGQALTRAPNAPVVHCQMGDVLVRLGRTADAVEAFGWAIALQPDLAEAHAGLGNLWLGQGALTAAETAYRRFLALRPAMPAAYMNLGRALQAQGRIAEAMDAFAEAARLEPDHPEARHAWLCGLNYRQDISSEALLAEHRRWAASVPALAPAAHRNQRDPQRRLRVGYVSGDYRRHPVGFFIAPVLENHSDAEVEVFCYSNDERRDAMTARLRSAADHWRDISALRDEAAADLIVEDGIDILIDLSGHTPGHRLELFARRPAPVQASWLGYPATTGLDAIDYLIIDPVTAPAGAETWCAEALVRLPHGRFTYAAPGSAPEPAAPPSLTRGHVTFGSFNNLAKLGPEVVAVWARVLHAVPGSRLVLKWAALGDDGVRGRIEGQFAAAGAPKGALELRGYSPHEALMGEYADIDVALDPFPFCGGLTSCEALWMGVPVVTWPKDRIAARQTLAFLHEIGLDDFAADSVEAFVAVAAALAGDEPRRTALRGELRARMSASPLGDARTFTVTLETAYRAMWGRWCAGESPAGLDIRGAA